MNDIDSQETMIGDESLAHLFRKTSRLMGRKHHHRRDHTRHAQDHALSIIRSQGPINQRELLEILDVRSSSLSEILGKLERNGLISREKNPEDKRSFVISAAGETESGSIGDASGWENADALFACLTGEEREQLRNILAKIVAAMKDEDPGSRRFFKHHRHGGRRHGRFRGRSDE